jgi:hypothetical protein
MPAAASKIKFPSEVNDLNAQTQAGVMDAAEAQSVTKHGGCDRQPQAGAP